MRHLWLFAHIFGFVLWMGGGLAAMNTGFALRNATRTEMAPLIGLLGRVHRAMILPGSVLVVISGLIMTLRLYGSATSVNGYPIPLMVMQGAGLLAAAMVLVVSAPTIGRLVRLDPAGEHAPLVAALLRRAELGGMLTGLLAMTALVSGVLLR